jgi:hypothetical protein
MSSATNIALNSRTMSGIILISDGIATLSDGDLNCEDITSNTLLTGSVSTGVITCNGELRTNTVGPYSIPISAISTTGSLISYGNVSNSGGTDFTNYGSTYNLLKQGFYFNNINSTTPLTNLAIIDNTQTYFKSQLTGCTAETPLNNTSVANKTYVDTNFVYKTGSITENINGAKTFTDDLTAPNIYCNTALYFRDINLTVKKALIFHQADIVYFDTLTIYDNYWKFKCFNIDQVIISQLSSTFNNNLISNAQATFNNFTPICSVATPTANNHLTRKDYVDSVVSGSSILSLNNTFTGFNTFSNVSGISIRGTLLLKDSTNVQESSIDLASGLLGIACAVNSGKILLQTKDAGGSSYTRLYADATEIKITAPLTLFFRLYLL